MGRGYFNRDDSDWEIRGNGNDNIFIDSEISPTWTKLKEDKEVNNHDF